MRALLRWWRSRQWGADRPRFRLVHDGPHLFIADPRTFPDRAIIARRVWEPRQRRMLRDLAHAALSAGGTYVFVDVGAYAGSYSMDAATDPRCARVVAFEPDLRNRRHLEANLFLNGLSDRVEVRAAAISQLCGTATVHKSGDHPTGNTGGCGIIDPAAYPVSVAQLVETVTLDSVLPLAGQVVVLKIDVEGHEREVLNGMRRLLAANRCVVQVEVLIDAHVAAVEAIFAAAGYRLEHEYQGDRVYVRSAPEPTAPAA